MTVLWFYIILTWSGDAIAVKGGPDFESCYVKQQAARAHYGKTMRMVSACIGLPVPEREVGNG